MKIHQFITSALFFAAGAFLAGAFGLTAVAGIACFFMFVCVLIAISSWNESRRFREMRQGIGDKQERESYRRAKGIQEGCEWDAGGRLSR